MQVDYIKSFNNVILGIVETDSNGNQTVRDFTSRRILGYYRAAQNITTDFYGRTIGRGNLAVSLIYKEHPGK